MTIEYAILGLLSWRPLSGYDIKKMFEGSPALYWSGNNNQIYKTLVDLHQREWVTRQTEMQEEGPARKIYTITARGLEELRRWVLSAPEMPQIRNTFLIQLAWADLLAPAELDALLAKYEEEMRIQLVMLRAQERQRNISPSGTPRDAYINITLARTPRETWLWTRIQENWIAYYQNELSWVSELRRSLPTA